MPFRSEAFLLQKIKTENSLLKHYNLRPYEHNPHLPRTEIIEGIQAERITQNLRIKLNVIEENFSKHYYPEVFSLFPKWLRIQKRNRRNAVDPLNNLLNLCYEVLEWKILKAIVRCKLDPYLGFLHSIQECKPSLACDLIEPFRAYIMNFLLDYSKTLKPSDFKKAYVKDQYPRYFLKHETVWSLIQNLNTGLFEAYIPIQRNRKHGFRMKFETFIDEYVSLTAKTINTPNIDITEHRFPDFACLHIPKEAQQKPEPKSSVKSQRKPRRGSGHGTRASNASARQKASWLYERCAPQCGHLSRVSA